MVKRAVTYLCKELRVLILTSDMKVSRIYFRCVAAAHSHHPKGTDREEDGRDAMRRILIELWILLYFQEYFSWIKKALRFWTTLWFENLAKLIRAYSGKILETLATFKISIYVNTTCYHRWFKFRFCRCNFKFPFKLNCIF